MRVVVIGAGSVGLTVAGTLLEAGCEVTLGTRLLGLPQIEDRPLMISGAAGTHVYSQKRFSRVATERIAEDVKTADFVAIATTAPEAPGCVRAIAERLHGSVKLPPFLLLQNGMGSDEEIKSRLPHGSPIFNGVVMTRMERVQTMAVHISSHPVPLRIGARFGAPQATIMPLVEAMNAGFLSTTYDADIKHRLLEKLLYNTCLNPLGALFGCTYGELDSTGAREDLLVRLADEAIEAIEAAHGLRLHRHGVDYIYEHLIPKHLRVTPHQKSSMMQDLQSGRLTEIDYINGAIANMAIDHELQAPTNTFITRLIHAAEGQDSSKQTTEGGIHESFAST